MTDSDVASNIIMSSISSPYLFVLNPQTHEFYLTDELMAQQITVDFVVEFFDDISNGSRQAYGGTGIAQRFQRLGYDIKSTVGAIFSESPWIAMLVFGVPTFVISLVCYTICCLAPADDDDEVGPSSDDEADDVDLIDNSASSPDELGSQHIKND